MEERWGIPYFEGSFYGVKDTSTSLRTIARMLVERGAPADLIDRTEILPRDTDGRVPSPIAIGLPRLLVPCLVLLAAGSALRSAAETEALAARVDAVMEPLVAANQFSRSACGIGRQM